MRSYTTLLAVAVVAGSAVADIADFDATMTSSEMQIVLDTLTDNTTHTVTFAAGDYTLDDALNISAPASLLCPGGGCYVECKGIDDVCFDFTASGVWDTIANSSVSSDEYQGFNFTDGNGSNCSLGEATAVYINSKVSSINTEISGGYLVATQKFDFWTEGRLLTNLGFGTCNYNDTYYDLSGDVLGHPSLTFNAACEVGVRMSLKFSSASLCATDNQVTATYSQFTTQLQYYMLENVTMFNETHALRNPNIREISTLANVITRFETIDNITSVITANYPRAEVEAKVVLIDVASVDGINTSRIVIETDIPTPYTLIAQTGTVIVSNTNAGITANAENYTVSNSCTETSIGGLCVQFIDFEVESCDLTGQYDLNGLEIQCAVGSDVTCPLLDGQVEPVDISFDIVSNNICDEKEIDLGGLFNISIDLCKYQNCTVLYDNYTEHDFTLGDTIYQRINLLTVETGVSISDAAVIQVDRTSDGNCSLLSSWGNYMKNYNGGAGPTGLTQDFVYQNASHAYIYMDNVATLEMACATADRSSNAVTHNYTVRVDYLDGFNDSSVNTDALSRRRSFSRRDALDKEVSSQVGVFSGEVGGEADELARNPQAPVTAAASTEEEDSTMLMVGIAAVLLLLCCCCCCCCAASAVGITVYKRRSSDKASMMDQPAMDAHSGVYLNANSV